MQLLKVMSSVPESMCSYCYMMMALFNPKLQLQVTNLHFLQYHLHSYLDHVLYFHHVLYLVHVLYLIHVLNHTLYLLSSLSVVVDGASLLLSPMVSVLLSLSDILPWPRLLLESHYLLVFPISASVGVPL